MEYKFRLLKKIALLLAFLVLNQAIFPGIAAALTSGPSQPEMQGFQPVGTTDMVDLFTGDFSYNIPLLDVGGYPVNLAYQSGSQMDSEASWVGLGWSVNPGVINREVRGFPDDFKNESIIKESNLKDDLTIGINHGVGLEFFGMFGLNLRHGIYYNTYRGFGEEVGVSPSISLGGSNKFLTASLGFSYDSQAGIDIDASASVGMLGKENREYFRISNGFNSRRGLKDLAITRPVLSADVRKTQSFSLGQFTYFPTSRLPLQNHSFSFHGTVGAAAFGVHPNLTANGYYTRQFLAMNRQQQKAYGLLYANEGQQSISNVLDFNNDLKGPYREDMPNLPIGYGTFDLFQASGQGISGQFRAVRNDIGIFRTGLQVNTSTSGNLGIELGGGGYFHVGGDINVASTNTTSKLWEDDNKVASVLPFTAQDQTYESVYLKSSGEKTVTSTDFYNKTGGDQAIRVDLQKSGSTVIAEKKLIKEKNKQQTGSTYLSDELKRDQREKRNQVFNYLTAAEAEAVGLDKWIYYYTEDSLIYPNCNNSNKDSIARDVHGDHHISEINVTQADGSRYVYGVPAYNTVHKEVSFSVAHPSGGSGVFDQTNANYGLVTYDSTGTDADNSIGNDSGEDHYFDSQSIPPYAHSYLLTGVLSADYVDRTGDGITDDDLGTAIKLNYSRTHTNYKWRVPYEQGKARFQEGYQSDEEDDKASYLYGEKEIWYLHSIESRTMVAQFYTSDRDDGLGVLTENGGKNSGQKLLKLDSIRLYSKSDLNRDGYAAVPIKTVHFEYDYTLCEGVPNQVNINDGKLTLKEVWFTYGHSQRGALNAYKFSYKTNDGTNDFDYHFGYYDRWGCYKKNPIGSPDNYPDNNYYPYALQDSTLAHDYSGAWNLKEIILPSGGIITVEYEPDDYAFVQNKRAGQMHFIAGFTDDPGTAPSNKLYNRNGTSFDINDYVAIDVPDGMSLAELKARYLGDVEKIYFQCLVSLDNQAGNDDYITGYMDYDKDNVVKSSDNDYLLLPVSNINVGNNKVVHPITMAALQTMRINLPQLVYPGYDNSSLSAEDLINTLLGFGNELRNITLGFENNSMLKNWARTVDVTNKSWIRLSNSNYKKYGGGARVKSLQLSDGWSIPNGGDTSYYGQNYTYETLAPVDGEMVTISSGVASYEPILGNEENLMRQPLPYSEEILLAPSNYYYTETPIGEALFPAPVVGYSEVKVESIHSGVGHSINKFYTAKEFPVITDFTKKDAERVRSNPILDFFKLKTIDHMAVSQGFMVEVNDMHGKPKEEAVYDDLGSLLSSTRYFYKVDDQSAQEKHLNNTVNVVEKDGSIDSDQIGVDVDVWQVMQEESNSTLGVGAAINTEGFPMGWIPIPIVIPIVMPLYQEESTQLRTAVTTKFIKRFGILDKVEVTENGSTIDTENVLFDEATGDVLLTKTQNEFDDPVYQFTYPAHWAYEGMEQAYQNIGAIFNNVTITNGEFTGGTDPTAYLYPGDELIVQKESTGIPESEKYYVTLPADELVVLNKDGYPLHFPSEPLMIKVVRSGHRNQASFPIGVLTSSSTPENGGNLDLDDSTDPLKAEAMIYSDDWQMECPLEFNSGVPSFVLDTINPYTSGIKGNFRPEKSYVFYNGRTPAALASTNIRQDGVIDSYAPFWSYDGGSNLWVETAPTGWTLNNTITIYDNNGNELENKDAIDVYSAATFGYNNTLATAVAGNAQKREIAFDGFEDYSFDNDCGNGDFYRQLRLVPDTELSNITDTAAHTGCYSLRMDDGKLPVVRINVNNNCPSEEALLLGQNALAKASFGNFTTPDSVHHVTTCIGCLPILIPKANEDYYVSAWIASDSSLLCGSSPILKLTVAFDQGGGPHDFFSSGPIIEGWQRLEAKFTIPSSANEVRLTFDNISENDLYLDDFRFHPWQSNMKSYVYDPGSLRLAATLDENNYATFYEYDDEGILIRVKRETERGVQTIQEGRTVLKPNN